MMPGPAAPLLWHTVRPNRPPKVSPEAYMLRLVATAAAGVAAIAATARTRGADRADVAK